MEDKPYQNREIDQHFKALGQRMDVFESNTSTTLEEIKMSVEKVDEKVSYTNGKVRKIIIALVFVVGIILGQGFTNWHEIINLISTFI